MRSLWLRAARLGHPFERDEDDQVDRSEIENFFKEQIDAIEKDHPDGWDITAAASLLEVRPIGSDEGELRNRFHGSSPNAVGILSMARESLIRSAIGE
jgi:hypothetical protein